MADQREDYYNAHRDDRMFEVPQSRLEEMTDTIKRLTADLAAARADAERLAAVLQRFWDYEHLRPAEYLRKYPDDGVYGGWYQIAVALHADAKAALAEHQRESGE